MSATLETTAPHRIVSEDESIILEATHIPGYTNRLEIEERWPRDMEAGDVWDKLAKEVYAEEMAQREAGTYVEFDESGRRVWLSNVMPLNALGMLESAKNFRGILDGLGYQIDVSTRRGSKNLITRKVCQYPSAQRINDFMFDVFGAEQGAEFVSHPGGDYGVTDFMEPFAEEGKVLVASEQPYEIHDLSDHALGWIGLTPSILRSLRASARLYLDRSEAEVRLLEELPPNNRGRESSWDDERTSKLFNPSSLVLTEMLGLLDRETGFMAEEMFQKEMHDTLRYTMIENARMRIGQITDRIFDLHSRDMMASWPGGLLGKAPDFDEAGAAVYERYRRADEAGREMAAAA
jgi:hypothetical protein